MAVHENKRAYGVDEALGQMAPRPIISRRNPTVRDRYEIGTMWVNRTANTSYICVNLVNGLAVWGLANTPVVGNLAVGGTLTAGTGLVATAGGLIVTAGGGLITAGDFDVTAGTINANGAGGIIASVGPITATVGNIVATAGDVIVTGGNLQVTVGDITVVAGNVVTTAGNITATAGDITATAGNIVAAGAGGITTITSDITAATGRLVATVGDVIGGGNLSVIPSLVPGTYNGFLWVGGPVIMQGNGAPVHPNPPAALGNIYINTAGGAGTTFYVCEVAGAWVGK